MPERSTVIEALSFWNILIHYRNQLLLICDKERLTKGMFFNGWAFCWGFSVGLHLATCWFLFQLFFFFFKSVPHLLFDYVGIETGFYSKCGSFLCPSFHHKNSIRSDDPGCHKGDISSFTSLDLRRMKLWNMKLENFCCTYAPGAQRLSSSVCTPPALPSQGRAEWLQLLPAFLGTSAIDWEKLKKLRIALHCTCNGLSSNLKLTPLQLPFSDASVR